MWGSGRGVQDLSWWRARGSRRLSSSASLRAAAASPPVAQVDDPHFAAAQRRVDRQKAYRKEGDVARNAVLFIGDGMDPLTVGAARIHKGQLAGESGENTTLGWEKWGHFGCSITYNTNQEVSQETMRDVCNDGKYHLSTTMEWAKSRGLGVGMVMTARVTHATPASNMGEDHWRHCGQLHGHCTAVDGMGR